METQYQIYLICCYNGQPLDFLLPVYSEAQFANVIEVAGTCFKIREPQHAEIMLACGKKDKLRTIRINIESACKANSNISFSIVVNEKDGIAFLRAYTDAQHNDFYPLPQDFLEQAQ